MALQPHPRSTVQQSRARGSPLIPAGHQPLGSDDYLSSERRGTPHEPTEGLDPSSCWSDHFNPHDTTLGRLGGNTEPKGGIDALDKSSSPGSAGEGATPAEMLSAKLPASSPPTEASSDPEGSGLTVAAIRPAAVNSRRDASIAQQHQSTRTWTNVRRGLGRAGTCPEPRCITSTIASAGRRRAATCTSAAAAVRRARYYTRLPLAGGWSLQGRERFGFFAACRAASWVGSRRFARLSVYG